MIVVDSSVWISFFANASNPEVDILMSIQDRTQILVGDMVLVEVLRGARSEAVARRIEADLRRFDVVEMVGPLIAVKAAQNFRQLRSLGITIRSAADLVIGTYCMENGHHLLHRDRDFQHMKQLGLKEYHPA